MSAHTVDATKIFEAITDYVEAAVDYALAARAGNTSAHNERIAANHARQTLRETLREELDP